MLPNLESKLTLKSWQPREVSKMKKIGVLLCCLCLVACSATLTKEEPVVKEQKKDEFVDISFAAVGDNLLHGAVYYWQQQAGQGYNFNSIYETTNYITQNVDVAYINQETPVGGEALGFASYPSFNGPSEFLDAIASAGFDWINFATNHSMDAGEQGILNEIAYLSKYPEIKYTGIHADEKDLNNYRVIERKGVKIGVLSYTYGMNGYSYPDGKTYLVDLIDKERIAKDMKQLNEISDIQLVGMHWGNEYQYTASEEQEELAQFLSDQGVDVIVGSHPHVIQPMDYVTSKNGNETLVIYSTGNFLSAQDEPERMLGGMPMWNMKFNKATGEFKFEEVKFLPTITYFNSNFTTFNTYTLKDYTDALASTHGLSGKGKDMSRQYFIDLVNSIMNDKVEIVY